MIPTKSMDKGTLDVTYIDVEAMGLTWFTLVPCPGKGF